MKINGNYTVVQNNSKLTFKRNWSEHVSWGANYIKETKKANFKLFSFPDARAVFVEIAQKADKKFGNIKERIAKLIFAQGTALTLNAIQPEDEESVIYPMEHKGNGIYEAHNISAQENAQYRYIIVDKNNTINLVKDPYTKQQPDINGWSEIYDSDNYEWKATEWLNGNDSRRIVRKPNEKYRGLNGLVIEEINIPTLSKKGTFTQAKSYIDKIAEKGIATAIEIMPVENTYSLQWGYDGVDKFAVNKNMGTSAELKEFIDYAHSKGLNVIMDMVPNHIGPDGNYLPKTGPYVKYAGQFGDVPNYESKDNRYVRDWMTNAALWWVNEYKVDGLRLDMTKLCESDYLLKQIVCEVNEHNPEVFLIAEDGRENKHTVTDYEEYEMSHEDELSMIDQSVDNIANKKWHTYPNNIGFDSEWDFPLMHALKRAVIYPDKLNLDDLDSAIWNSNYRVKFAMSHDEIGNEDGTRLVSKSISSTLDLFNKVKGNSNAEKGQNAAKLSQKILELFVNQEINNYTDQEFSKYLNDYGLREGICLNKKEIENAFMIAYAKQKLANACIMTIPGPKMYFQGDDAFALSQFKFFRELSDYKINPHTIKAENQKKGYNTLEKYARADSIIDSIKSKNQDYENTMLKFNQDLANLVKNNKVLQIGKLINTFKDWHHQVHIHHLKLENEEVIVIKNFGQNFHNKSYGFANFPTGNWTEIFNSDKEIYSGSNYINTNRKDSINSHNQNLNLAPNSIIILNKI